MIVKIWGVRGSVPSGNPETSGVGGNTTCVEVRCGDETFILDTGTGMRNLGAELAKKMPVRIKILYTHVHWDHIQGLPFFPPLYVKGNEIEIYGGSCLPVTIEEVLHQQMKPPVFPVSMEELPSTVKFFDIRPGHVIEGKNYRITLEQLNHPGGSYAYRFDSEGQTLVFATDVEPYENRLDEKLVAFCRDVDLLIFDAQFTEEEYHGRNGKLPRIGWGHSTMPEAVKLARASGVKQLVLFHHDPSHDDNFVRDIEVESRKLFPRSLAAYEGMEIDLQNPLLSKSLFD